MHLCMCTCLCNLISSLLHFNTKKSHIGNQEICVLWMLDKFKRWYKNKVSDGHPKKYVNRLVRFKFVFNNCPYVQYIRSRCILCLFVCLVFFTLEGD